MNSIRNTKVYVRKGASAYYTNFQMEGANFTADYYEADEADGYGRHAILSIRPDGLAVRKDCATGLKQVMGRLPRALRALIEEVKAAAAAAEEAAAAAEEPAAAAPAPAPVAPVAESAYWSNPAPRRGRALYGLQAAEDGPQIDFNGALVGGRVVVIPSLMKADLRDAARYAKALRDRLFDASPAAQAGILRAFWRSATNNYMNDSAAYTVYTMANSVLAQCRDLTPARARRLLMWALAEFATACKDFAEQFAPEIATAIPANENRIDISFQPAGHADDLWLIGFMLMPLVLIIPLIIKVEGL